VKKPTAVMIVLIAVVCSLFIVAPALAAAQLNTNEKQLMASINKVRAKHGLVKFRVNEKLWDAARGHSTEMSEKKYFYHASYGKKEVWSARILRYGYKYRTVGEDIYWAGGLTGCLPSEVVKAWMKSPAHRKVILTRAFRDIGPGAAMAPDGYGKCTGAVWFYTLDLGRRR